MLVAHWRWMAEFRPTAAMARVWEVEVQVGQFGSPRRISPGQGSSQQTAGLVQPVEEAVVAGVSRLRHHPARIVLLELFLRSAAPDTVQVERDPFTRALVRR